MDRQYWSFCKLLPFHRTNQQISCFVVTCYICCVHVIILYKLLVSMSVSALGVVWLVSFLLIGVSVVVSAFRSSSVSSVSNISFGMADEDKPFSDHCRIMHKLWCIFNHNCTSYKIITCTQHIHRILIKSPKQSLGD
jgi:hypothetical protein